ncbi:MAG TPA: PPOX class F420-dependent oxidoreductase [Candidatus Solibacter sp.]|nr:PPOX class F420-dependent oxidoreductase [Candidatus Solibacter sp.]
MSALSSEIKELIDRPNFAHFATLMPDGSPNATPVWIGREGDRVIINTSESSLKAKNTKHDPRVAISIVDFDNPYEEVQLRGRVVERRPDAEFKTMDLISHKYTGKPFPMRNLTQITMIIEIDKARYMKLPFAHTPPK